MGLSFCLLLFLLLLEDLDEIEDVGVLEDRKDLEELLFD